MALWQLYKIRITVDGKDYYYVGKTRNFYIRMEQHLDKQGSAWLKQFPQDAIDNAVTQQIDGEIDDNSSYKETLETLKLMVEHGVRYVRGAEYSYITRFTKVEYSVPYKEEEISLWKFYFSFYWFLKLTLTLSQH